MKGKAPNSPATGSHVVPRQKPRPNFSMESQDWLARTIPIPTTIRQIRAAKAPVPRRKPTSPRPAVRDGFLDVGSLAYLIFARPAISNFTTLAGTGPTPT